jgi:glycerophosphoryl diester phosphodiesterase
VALISLNYDIISYAETQYPEFTTGTLFFIGIGDVSALNCDLLIMEEETATESRISQIHNAGKEAIVWTVNTEASMQSFLDSSIDGVITDEILLAKKVQAQLDGRTDLQVLQHRLGSIWY